MPRTDPDFLVIGGRRCGSTSLFHYLRQHPQIRASPTKEIHFFDSSYWKGSRWYRSHFPSAAYRSCYQRLYKKRLLSFEGTPYYLSHPLVPKRASEILPNARLIVLLRNPVDRCFSDWKHSGTEALSFEDSLECEDMRLEGEEQKILASSPPPRGYFSPVHLYHSYRNQGIYEKFLRRWLECFDEDRFCIIQSEDLYERPDHTMRGIYDFLGLEHVQLERYEKYNSTNDAKMSPDTRKRLEEFYAPHNQKLYDLIGKRFDWQ